MAYDPKSYLNQALQQGFESVYSQPASFETGEAPQYQGDVATFGDVQVRPLMELVGGSEQEAGTPQQSGHIVSVPLTGQYEGYFRNDIYDSQGNFVRTAISEPDNDPYGLKGLAQLGLTALSAGALGPTGQLFAKGIGAIGALQSGDPLRILGAISGLPGAGDYIPAELSTLAKYAGQAGQIKSALSGDPSAIFRLVSGADKSGALPKGLAGDIDLSGADAIEGFFAPGGEGYVDPNAGNLPDWALDPYKNEEVDWAALYAQPTTNPVTGETIVGADQSGYPVQDFGALPQSDINDVYNRIINDRGGFASTWQTVGSDRVMAQDDGSAIGLNTETGETYGLDPAQTQRMIDAGLLNTAASGYDAAIRGTSPPTPAPKPATPGKAPTPSPAPKAAKPGMDIGALFALLGAMGGQQPTQAPAPYQTARINTESPFGLMYGLES